MAVRGPKRPRDTNQLAWQIVREATEQEPIREVRPIVPPSQPARAAALGGLARARALTPTKRKTIAKAAASARWKKR